MSGRRTWLVIAAFALVGAVGWERYTTLLNALPEFARWIEMPLRAALLCGLGLYLAHRTPVRAMPRALGLAAPAGPAMLYAFIGCSPLLIGPLLFGATIVKRPITEWVFLVALLPLSEESMFRGFAFRQLYRHGKVPFPLAAALSGSVFGLVHLSNTSMQGLHWIETMATVGVIAVGGAMAAWVFVQWDDNLWAPFGLHLFINLWWLLFDMGNTALGGAIENVWRISALLLILVLTLIRHRIPWLCESPASSVPLRKPVGARLY